MTATAEVTSVYVTEARPPAWPALTAELAAELIRAAGVPCVTLVDDDQAATAVPATPKGEGLRVVRGSMPVRIAYPIPLKGDDRRPPALSRRDSHVLWLYGWAEDQHWSAWRDADDEWITISPDPRPALYHDSARPGGRRTIRRTGRAIDEHLGSHALIQVITDADLYAASIEADALDRVGLFDRRRRGVPAQRKFAYRCGINSPRADARDTAIAAAAALARDDIGHLERRRLECAARVRAAGPARTVRSVEWDEAHARHALAASQTSTPGLRHEIAPVTAYAACRTCYCPMIEADGRWWHHTGNFPAECPGPRKRRSLPTEPGDWEFGPIGMTCGFCGQSVSWPDLLRSWVRLTGTWILAVLLEPAQAPGLGYTLVQHQPGELVVLAETEPGAGPARPLPHYCKQIPPDLYGEYADQIAAALAAHHQGATDG